MNDDEPEDCTLQPGEAIRPSQSMWERWIEQDWERTWEERCDQIDQYGGRI